MSEKPSRLTPESDKGAKDFERYKKWLHFDEKQLEGKTILDVGSANAHFGEYVEKNIPNTTVIRFDYYVRKHTKDEPGRIDFRARAAQLPLRPGSVDLALAHASISINPGEEMLASLKEIFETMKAGGEMRVAPIFDAPFDLSQNRLQLVREYVKDLEVKGLATAEWIDDGTEEREWKGKNIKETRYCLVLNKLFQSQS